MQRKLSRYRFRSFVLLAPGRGPDVGKSIYGVWDGVVHDFRRIPQGGQVTPVEGLDNFDPNNPTKAFIADRGFFVFNRDTSLVAAFAHYMKQAARESCGRCTPCRVGTQRLRDLLLGFPGTPEAQKTTLDEIEEIARQVTESSLCGMGQSCARSLLAALRHFPDEFKPLTPAQSIFQHSFIYTTAPCIEACPSKIDVPKYIDGVKGGKFDYALGVILDKYPLAATCGRVCVRFCEAACRRNAADGPVAIRLLKRYAADQAIINQRLSFKPSPVQHEKRVAIVGAGPAGITCAYKLLLKGIKVDIFDAQKSVGGMASIGIPSYRLPKDILKAESEDVIRQLGGQFFFNKILGEGFSVDNLLDSGYDAVFLAYGASQGSQFGIQNEYPGLERYITGVDFLLKVHGRVEHGEPYEISGDVVVVGGGNVAMDCVRSARRMGAKSVHLVYRRSREDMPAEKEEIIAAEHEGIIFHFLTTPTALNVENNVVQSLQMVNLRLAGRDARGRNNIEEIPDSHYTMPCDLVVAAIGQQVERNVIKPGEGIELDRWNCIVVNPDTLQTTRDGVFAGGDCVLGPLTLVNALDHGERAAGSIYDYLMCGEVHIRPEHRLQKILAKNKLLIDECLKTEPIFQPPAHSLELDAAERIKSFDEVELAVPKETAYAEANRCLRCYRMYSVVTEKLLKQPHLPIHKESVFME